MPGSITLAIASLSLSGAAAFVRRLFAVCGIASLQVQEALHALVAALRATHSKLPSATAPSQPTKTSTTRSYRYTIHYTPKRRSITLFAIEYEVVDWTSTIIDHADGSIECIATPVYAECPPRPPLEMYDSANHDVIETRELLDMDKILLHKKACAVTCEEITTTTTTMITKTITATAAGSLHETDDEATASESDSDGHPEQLPQQNKEDETNAEQLAHEDDKDEMNEEDSEENDEEREVKSAKTEAEHTLEEEEERKASEQEGEKHDGGENQQEAPDEATTTNTGTLTGEDMQRAWPTLTLEDVDANAPFEWTISTSRRPLSLQRAVGSVLLQRRLLGL